MQKKVIKRKKSPNTRSKSKSKNTIIRRMCKLEGEPNVRNMGRIRGFNYKL